MAVIKEFSPEEQELWDDWLADKPEVIRQMATEKPPNRLYRIDTGHRVTILSYAENRTVRVAVTGKWNLVAFERAVFGIPFDELVECELPSPDEALGVSWTNEEGV